MTLGASWKFGRLDQTSSVRLIIALLPWTCHTFPTFLALIVFVATTVSLCSCRSQLVARHLKIGGICVRCITSNLLIAEFFDTLDGFWRKLLLLGHLNLILVRSYNVHIHVVFGSVWSQFVVQILAILSNVRVRIVFVTFHMVWTCFNWLLLQAFLFGNLDSHTVLHLLKFRCLFILRRPSCIVVIVDRLRQKLINVDISWGDLNLWLNLLLVL